MDKSELQRLLRKRPDLAELNPDLDVAGPSAAAMPSRLEELFVVLWTAADGPTLEREYRFEPGRKWRADFASEAHRVLIEIEGGIYSGGRHVRAQGYAKDCEKYNAASMAGWAVIRLTTKQINADYIGTIAEWVRGRS